MANAIRVGQEITNLIEALAQKKYPDEIMSRDNLAQALQDYVKAEIKEAFDAFLQVYDVKPKK